MEKVTTVLQSNWRLIAHDAVIGGISFALTIYGLMWFVDNSPELVEGFQSIGTLPPHLAVPFGLMLTGVITHIVAGWLVDMFISPLISRLFGVDDVEVLV